MTHLTHMFSPLSTHTHKHHTHIHAHTIRQQVPPKYFLDKWSFLLKFYMTWVELFLKSKHLRETRLLMKIYQCWQTYRSGNDLTGHFIQILQCIAEKLLPREAKLSCPRLYSHLLAKLTLRDFRPPRSPHQFSSVQSLSRLVVSYSETPWIVERQASLSITNSRSSLRLTSKHLSCATLSSFMCYMFGEIYICNNNIYVYKCL